MQDKPWLYLNVPNLVIPPLCNLFFATSCSDPVWGGLAFSFCEIWCCLKTILKDIVQGLSLTASLQMGWNYLFSQRIIGEHVLWQSSLPLLNTNTFPSLRPLPPFSSLLSCCMHCLQLLTFSLLPGSAPAPPMKPVLLGHFCPCELAESKKCFISRLYCVWPGCPSPLKLYSLSLIVLAATFPNTKSCWFCFVCLFSHLFSHSAGTSHFSIGPVPEAVAVNETDMVPALMELTVELEGSHSLIPQIPV